ncbi:MAG TPA: FAD-binding protein, partial [Ilumatobacteraceae bacterium]|nr:FAD-binding protein [Ilumatobacteraceae bacterium]
TELPDFAAIAAREVDDIRCGGPALVAALFKGLIDRGVEIRTETAARSLIRDGERVSGIIADGPDGEITIRARRGVILASGGFEWNTALVDAFVGQQIFPLSPPYNEGDGLLMGLQAGAALGNMGGFWGQPAILDPDVDFEGQPMYQMGTFRSTPGVIVVNRHGKRFANEGITYQDFPKTTQSYDPRNVEYPNDGPVWMIFDQAVRDHGVILPAVTAETPTPPWVFSADSLEELAGQIEVDPHGLAATVERWNGFVADGNDADFGRGTMRFETHMSGHFPSPENSLRPIQRGPFYAVRLYNGALGTNGGLRIDADGRVLRARPSADGQQVIDGLYAAGNVTANVWGKAYPGGGATIGPAMVYGYCAGRHAAANG